MNGLTRHVRLPRPAMMGPTFAQLRRGAGDPTHRQVGDMYLRATRTPAGPSLIKIVRMVPRVAARAWGAGASGALISCRGCSAQPTIHVVSARLEHPRWSRRGSATATIG
jgi:hypothetical protein